MLTKSLLTIAFLSALSATAQAGATISDRRYLPNEARRTTQEGVAIGPRDVNSAYAYGGRSASEFPYDRYASEHQFPVTTGGPAWRYHGGPKSN